MRAPILSLPNEVTEKYQVSVTTPEQLDAAQIDRWRQLQQADPDLFSPYFCPEFTCLAASVRDDIQVAVIYENDEIKGFFPFQKSSQQSAVPVAGPVSDYHGLVIEKGYPVDALHLLRQCGLKSWKFNHLVASQPCLQSYHQVNDISYLIDMSDGFESYLEGQRASGSKLVSSIGRKRRKLEREIGPIRFVYHSSDPAVLAQMFEWKSEQYRRTEKVDVFSFDWTRDLIEAVWKTGDRDFAGVLSALYAGDVLVAVHMGMRSREVWHWWFPTYNPEFARYSPGSIFLLEMAQIAADHGIKVIDLGKGESRYKDQFHNRQVELAEGSISLSDFPAKLSQVGESLADLIRRTPLVVPARIPARLVRRYRKMKEFD